ncbi:MAG: hypothetical protein KDA98_12180, partial [Acidimicrobiales bacterium]|nr:hypothetical protein [Acidimicrobiales bacterium]
LGWLTLAFTGAHLFGLWADDYIQFGPKELFVPMAASWQPGAVAWGVAAMYRLLVVQLTSWGMRKLPRKVWHAIHYLSLPMFVTGTVHGILAGTDFGSAAVGWGLIVGCSAVVWFATFRVLAPSRASRSNDRLAAARAARAGAVNPQALTRSRPARAGEAPTAP